MRVTHAGLTIFVTSFVTIFVLLGMGSCTPLHDLDKVSSGRRDAMVMDGENQPTDVGGERADGLDAPIGTGGVLATGGAVGTGGATGTGGAVGDGGLAPGDAPITDAAMVAGDAAMATGGAVSDSAMGTGGRSGMGGQPTAQGGVDGGGGGTGGTGGTGGATGTLAADLPEIFDSPVVGTITYSAGASWDIDGDQWPVFEIHTPTASYWLVKSAAAIVSINDRAGLQWINYSHGFRPNRGVPNLGGCCQPGDPVKLGLPPMTTEVDPAFTITSTHLRLVSKSADASYWLVWDFYLTHFTLTINRAGKAFGFTYRGVPGGAFGGADQLVLSSGKTVSPTAPHAEELDGPAEWAYLTHPATSGSLFLIQHADDALTETYQLADGDTGMFVFGGGRMVQTPIRFSLGLVDNCDPKRVQDRIAFVRNATPAP